MRELRFVPEESTASSLVFANADTAAAGAGAEEYFVEVTPALRKLLVGEEKVQDEAPRVEQVQPPADKPRETTYSAPLSLRPREIQERIRSGSSIEELAQEMGVIPERIESFAHPVMTERHRMAELARGGYLQAPSAPGTLTLGEQAAQAFSRHDYDMERATWDAYRDSAGSWIATLTWTAGFTEYVAGWYVTVKATGPTMVEAKNSTATDLIAPRSTWHEEPEVSEDVEAEPEQSPEPSSAEEDTITGELVADDELLQNPPAQQTRNGGEHRKRRRRKSATPHWEDVLLGVRATRPKNGGKDS